MTFTNLKKRVASLLGYVDSTGAIISTKDISETDIGNWVNDRYIDDLVAAISTQYPEDYEIKSTANFYKATGTVAATATDTTLDATTAIFNNGMVGDTVYNSTDGASAIITAYTDTTTVTIDTDVDTDWVGDTIYVLGHEFALGGDATDVRGIRWVGVKYDSNDTYYRTCTQADQNYLSRSGNEKYSQTSPVWYPTTSSVSSVLTTTIGILPEPTKNVANGIQIRYVQVPAALSDASDVPRLPLASHTLLVQGATADGLKKMLRYEEASSFEQRYQVGKQEMIATYALTRQSQTPRMRPSRNLREMMERTK